MEMNWMLLGTVFLVCMCEQGRNLLFSPKRASLI